MKIILAMVFADLTFHKIAGKPDEFEFDERLVLTVEIDQREICIAKYQGNLFAFPAKCPHASGRLEKGFIDAIGNIVCPVHKYRFSIQNGRNTSGEGYHLKTYPVEVREDGVYVGLHASLPL